MAQLKDTIVSGNLRVTDTTLTDTLQVTKIKAPTTSGGTTYGVGTNGQVLKSNGTSTYWASDSNSDVNVTQTATTTDATYEILFSGTADNTTRTETSRKNSNLKFNPSTGSLYTSFIYAGGDESQSTYPAGGYHVYDCRNVSVTPANGDKTANFYFHMTGTPDTSKWWSIMHVKGWAGAYSAWEIAGPANNSDQKTTPLYVRTSNASTAWGSWRKIYDASNPPTASEVGALSTSTKYALSTSVGGNAILADGLAIKTLTAETLDTSTGSFVFKGDQLLGDTYDWVGLQVDGSNDAFQLMANGQLMFRQNDTTSKTSANWGEWRGCLLPSNVIGSGGITVTQNDITIGSGETAFTYKGAVTISHSNSIAEESSVVFKKIKYDGNGHITGVANVAKADITALGIPAQDTKYGISGAYGANSNTWVTTITAGGSGTTSTVPTASTSAYGITKLYDGVDSTSTGLAATANAVKTAYDKANHSHPYLPLAGGTMTGPLTMKANQYSGTYGLDMNNSDIVGANRIVFADLADSYTEGLAFYRTTTDNVKIYDNFWIKEGVMYFTPNAPTATTNYTVLHTGNLSTYVKASTNNGKISVNGSDVTVYTHPTKTPQSTSDFYKITVDDTGHVTTGDALTAANLPAHTHAYAGSATAGGIANQAHYLVNERLVSTSMTYGSEKLEWYDLSGNDGSDPTKKQNPQNDWFHHITMHHKNNAGYYFDMAYSFNSNAIFYRRVQNGADKGWVRLIDSSNIGSQTVSSAATLSTPRNISLGTGVTSTATAFDGSADITIPVTGIKEAYLTWGGKDFTQSFSPLDAALEPRLGANRLEMCAGTSIKIERTTDGGTSWTEVTTSSINNANRSTLFSSSAGYTVPVSATSTAGMGTDAAKYMMRITLDTSVASVYTVLNKFILNISSQGAANCYVKLRIRTAANVTAGSDTWLTWDKTNKTWSSSPAEADTRCPIGGWSGFNVINTAGVTTYGNNTSQYRNIQFIFGCTKNDSTSAGLVVINIQGYGGVAWNAPSNMARTGHLYSWNGTGAATFPSSITANGNLIASSASGDSPALIFKRGTLTDNLNDWKIYVSSGHLYFDQSTANASSETWTHKMYYHTSNSNLYIGSSPVLHSGNTSFTQTLSSGTKIGSITIAGTATDIYAPTNTDTKVNVTLGTTTKAYLLGTSTTPTSTAQAVTSIADTGVYLGTEAGSLYATTLNGSLNGAVYHTATNPASESLYYLPFVAKATTEYKWLCVNDGIAYRTWEGTTSADGAGLLSLGNGTAHGTAGNKKGYIRMYSETANFIQITAPGITDRRDITFQDKSGTVALTSDIPSFSVTSSGTGPVVTGMSYSSGVLTYTKGRVLSTSGGQWIAGRDNAPVLANSSSSTANGFYPLAAVKTNTGAWSIGALGNGDSLAFSFSTDTNYSGGVNTTNNYYIGTDGAFTGTAAGLTTKAVTASTINTTPGSFVFGGTNIIGGINDWVGFQADAGNDRFQIIANSQLVFRQNDTTTIESWDPWIGCLTPNNVSGDSGITITNISTTIGTGTTALTYNSGVKISHTNSITASTSEVFKKFSYDANGHITGTANVGASDIPALNYVKTAPSVNYDINQAGFYAVMANKNTDNPNIDLPTANQWWHVLSMSWAGTSSDLNYWIGQLAIPTYQNKLNGLYWRTNSASNTALSADDWKRIYCEEKLTPSTTTKTRNILHIYGSTVGNTASELVSGVKGVLSYGDAGPQINFSTAATIGSTQDSAIIWTDNDSAATGVSWHFVSNQSDWNVISKRFHARTGISIGTDLPNTTYNLYVNGTTYHSDAITFGSTTTQVSPALNIYTRTYSTYNTLVKWSNGSTWGTRGAEIGYHNTGGDSTYPGAICILPYQTDSDPWAGQVGLFITKDHVYIDGTELSKTDANVLQTSIGSTYTNYRPLLIGASNSSTGGFTPTTTTDGTYATAGIYCQPSSGKIYASEFITNTYLSASGSSLATNGLYLKSYFKCADSSHTVLQYSGYGLRTYSGKIATADGLLVAVGCGGLTILGGGESANNLSALISDDQKISGKTTLNVGGALNTSFTGNSEIAIISSDSSIYLITNCQTIANRKPVCLDTSSNFYPGTNKTGSIGTSTYMWNTIYGATVQSEQLAVKSGTYTTTIEKGSTTADRTLVLPDASGGIGIANILLNDPTNSTNPVSVSGSLSDYDYFTIVISMNGSNSDQSSSAIIPAIAGSHYFLFQVLESVGSGGSMMFPAGVVITTTSSSLSFSVGVNRGINIPSSGTATSIATPRTAYIKMIIGHKS